MIKNALGKTIRKGRIGCAFVLEQRMFSSTGLSYLSILTAMCTEFGCNPLQWGNLNTFVHNGRTYYVFALTSMVQLSLLVAYLDSHPLLTSKFLDYQD